MDSTCISAFTVGALIDILSNMPNYEQAGGLIEVVRDKVAAGAGGDPISCHNISTIYIKSLPTALYLHTECMIAEMIAAGLVSLRPLHVFHYVNLVQYAACNGSVRILAAIFTHDPRHVYHTPQYSPSPDLLIDRIGCDDTNDTWRVTIARAMVLASHVHPYLLAKWWGDGEKRFPLNTYPCGFDWEKDMAIMDEIARCFIAWGAGGRDDLSVHGIPNGKPHEPAPYVWDDVYRLHMAIAAGDAACISAVVSTTPGVVRALHEHWLMESRPSAAAVIMRASGRKNALSAIEWDVVKASDELLSVALACNIVDKSDILRACLYDLASAERMIRLGTDISVVITRGAIDRMRGVIIAGGPDECTLFAHICSRAVYWRNNNENAAALISYALQLHGRNAIDPNPRVHDGVQYISNIGLASALQLIGLIGLYPALAALSAYFDADDLNDIRRYAIRSGWKLT